MIDVVEYRRLAKSGLLQPEQVAEVVLELKHPQTDNTYDLLYILGMSHAKEYRDVVEGHLHHSDPLIRELSLDILCNEWKDASLYTDILQSTIVSDVSDEGIDIRTTAMLAAGSYLRHHDHDGLLRGLLYKFDDTSSSDSERYTAYNAIMRAMSVDWRTILRSSFKGIDLVTDVDLAIVDAARRRVLDA